MPIYLDYANLTFTDTRQEYKFIDKDVCFIATEIMLLADHHCYVKFGGTDENEILILVNQPMIFNRTTYRIQYIRTNAADGNLKVWAEGNVEAI